MHSQYGQIRHGSDQVAAIDAYEEEVGLRVYYQRYNPWSVPFVQQVPLVAYAEQAGEPELGVRIVPAGAVHAKLADSSPPRLNEFEELAPLPAFGWRLEEFVCDQVLACHEGDRFETVTDPRIQRLFNRRTGAIAAAIAITIEAPAQAA